MTDYASESEHLRNDLTSEQRTADVRLTIDAGFVHHSRVEALVGAEGMGRIDAAVAALPSLPEGIRQGRIDHIYVRTLLDKFETLGVPGLREILAGDGSDLFSSTETLAPTPELGDAERVETKVEKVDADVLLTYSTARVRSDTLRSRLREGAELSVVAQLREKRAGTWIFEPLVIGAPWLVPTAAAFSEDEAMWWTYAYFEIFPEDFDEFARVKDHDLPDDFSVMRMISESAFKSCLAEILGDTPTKDWGGETSDHFSAHVHLRGRPASAAFLLKGPARFAPMRLNHLGQNNDQILRLAREPAGLLVVQHCHDISPDVRETLRTFAVRPGAARRYCCIDGRESLRLLIAYDKLDRALGLSKLGAG
jgi:hypothetical protein